MKIYLGHNCADSDKISTSLKDRGIALLRAAPSEIKLVGLYRVAQSGYEFYSGNLPAFMRATELNRRIAISGSGFPVATKFENLLPINFPPVFMQMDKKKTPDDIFASKWTEYISRKDKTGYLVDFRKEMLQSQNRKEIAKDTFAPGQATRFSDVPSMVTIARVFSSFLRTHKYPAFANNDHFEEVRREDMVSPLIFETDENDDEDPEKRKVRIVMSAEGVVHGYSVKKTSAATKKTHKIVFQAAKPVTSLQSPWGSSNKLPQTDGIHFPYIRDLSKPDKDTVPRVIERYFLRALSNDTELCLKVFGEIATSWKTSLYTTSWGHDMSHLARVIELAIPSQARVFPIVDSQCYFGSYLSGAGLSIALGNSLFRPDSYETNVSELSAYSENGSLISLVVEVAQKSNADEDAIAKLERACKASVRAVALCLDNNFNIDPEDQENVCQIVSRIRFSQPYRVVNSVNMIWMMQGIESGETPHWDEPMYPMDMFSTDIFIKYLGCFGANVPSPNLPGAPQMKLTGTLPDKFNKVVGVRLVDSTTAMTEWKRALASGQITNGVENLAAKYEHSAISGKEAKEKWFAGAVRFSEWWKKNAQSEVKVGKNVQGEDDFVAISVGEGFDFAGF
jgi:hypothetical protein